MRHGGAGIPAGGGDDHFLAILPDEQADEASPSFALQNPEGGRRTTIKPQGVNPVSPFPANLAPVFSGVWRIPASEIMLSMWFDKHERFHRRTPQARRFRPV